MMLLACFVGDLRWKRIETDMIAGPSRTLEGRGPLICESSEPTSNADN